MSGLTGLIDALLAARLAPRLDVLGIKPEATIGAPGPVIEIGKIENDVRLPSNAALDRLVPGSGAVQQPAGGTNASASAQLSVAARVISAVLADLGAAPGPVRGAAPAWPSPQGVPSTALAGTLAQTVADSGLFYESHLVQFAAGTRTLAQLSQEPQARWASPVAATHVAAPQAAAAQGGAQAAQSTAALAPPSADAVDMPAAAVLKDVLTAAAAQGTVTPQAEGESATQPASNAGPAARASLAHGELASSTLPQQPVTTGSAEADARTEATRMQAAYRWAESAAPGQAAGTSPAHRVEEAARQVSAASAANAQPASAVEVIHPQAVSLVHQQLDLLASSQFRWSGEAWPGVPMNWSIEEEARERGEAVSGEAVPRRWSTMLSLTLPRLGAVDLRLSLTGPIVQAHLAGEGSTVTRMRAEGGSLSSRFEAAGLRLQELQVSERVAA